MTRKNKNQLTSSRANQLTDSRMRDYREHLKTITNGLKEMAKAAGRENVKVNQLLKECYNLVDAELDTYDGWMSRGAHVRRGQHAYLFWGKPIKSESGFMYCPVNFLFAREQVMLSSIEEQNRLAEEEYMYK